MRVKKVILFFSIFLFSIILFNSKSFASSLDLNLLDFDVQLNKDGSMDVVETWDIRIQDVNTLFKTFEIDNEKYSSITNVTVQEVLSDGRITNFQKINEEMYHVTKGCYYALKNSSGNFEIAWGVSVDNATKKYKISYKVTDAIKRYADYNELYWQFIGKDFEISSKQVTGTIKLPEEVSTINNLRAWGHGQLNGEVDIVSQDTVKFVANNYNANNYLEIRLAVLDNIFNIQQTSNKTLSTAINEETKWANQANLERGINIFLPIIILLLISIFFIIKILKYYKILKNTPKLEPETKVEYYREIPNENTTPAEANFIYNFKGNEKHLNTQIPEIMSSTMLDLSLKGFLEFQTDNSGKKENLRITLKNKDNIESLKEDEKTIYRLLIKIADSNDSDSFTIEDFEKYAKKRATSFMGALKGIDEKVRDQQEKEGNYDPEVIKMKNNYSGFGIVYFILAAILFVISMAINTNIIFVVIPVILAIIAMILCIMLTKRFSRLTQKGINEKELWTGLKKYMEEFSLLDERTVPELALWEKYLVYATAFGIADKVLKQLKIKYPEIMDENYYHTHNTFFMYMMINNTLDRAFINSVNQSVSRAYTTYYSGTGSGTSFSSGGGFGGGFSGGGGFGGGRWWRPEADKN